MHSRRSNKKVSRPSSNGKRANVHHARNPSHRHSGALHSLAARPSILSRGGLAPQLHDVEFPTTRAYSTTSSPSRMNCSSSAVASRRRFVECLPSAPHGMPHGRGFMKSPASVSPIDMGADDTGHHDDDVIPATNGQRQNQKSRSEQQPPHNGQQHHKQPQYQRHRKQQKTPDTPSALLRLFTPIVDKSVLSPELPFPMPELSPRLSTSVRTPKKPFQQRFFLPSATTNDATRLTPQEFLRSVEFPLPIPTSFDSMVNTSSMSEEQRLKLYSLDASYSTNDRVPEISLEHSLDHALHLRDITLYADPYVMGVNKPVDMLFHQHVPAGQRVHPLDAAKYREVPTVDPNQLYPDKFIQNANHEVCLQTWFDATHHLSLHYEQFRHVVFEIKTQAAGGAAQATSGKTASKRMHVPYSLDELKVLDKLSQQMAQYYAAVQETSNDRPAAAQQDSPVSPSGDHQSANMSPKKSPSIQDVLEGTITADNIHQVWIPQLMSPEPLRPIQALDKAMGGAVVVAKTYDSFRSIYTVAQHISSMYSSRDNFTNGKHFRFFHQWGHHLQRLFLAVVNNTPRAIARTAQVPDSIDAKFCYTYSYDPFQQGKAIDFSISKTFAPLDYLGRLREEFRNDYFASIAADPAAKDLAQKVQLTQREALLKDSGFYQLKNQMEREESSTPAEGGSADGSNGSPAAGERAPDGGAGQGDDGVAKQLLLDLSKEHGKTYLTVASLFEEGGPLYMKDGEPDVIAAATEGSTLHRHVRAREKRLQAFALSRAAARLDMGTLAFNVSPYQRTKLPPGLAISAFRYLFKSKNVSLVALVPLTNRRHQLRVQCAADEGLQAPIVGDPLYGLWNAFNYGKKLDANQEHYIKTVIRHNNHKQLHLTCHIASFIHPLHVPRDFINHVQKTFSTMRNRVVDGITTIEDQPTSELHASKLYFDRFARQSQRFSASPTAILTIRAPLPDYMLTTLNEEMAFGALNDL